jgi:hypothetical protein
MNDLAYYRRVEFRKGYNKRHIFGYGVHGMEIHFRFYGPLGTTQFVMGTGWVPGEIGRPFGEKRNPHWSRIADRYPNANDLGYHWLTPQYEGQEDYRHDDCPFVKGGVCYYDGSGMNAEPVMQAFVDRGESAVWRELVSYYRTLRDEALVSS